jgi:serine/threonine protein phosphatase PrpC
VVVLDGHCGSELVEAAAGYLEQYLKAPCCHGSGNLVNTLGSDDEPILNNVGADPQLLSVRSNNAADAIVQADECMRSNNAAEAIVQADECMRTNIAAEAIVQAEATMRTNIAAEAIVQADACIRRSGEDFAQTQGATATVAVVDGNVCYLAWLGDSAAALCTPTADGSGECAGAFVTEAHLPARGTDEAARAESLGGKIGRFTRELDDGNEYAYGPWRLFSADGGGGLAVSRALGDLAISPALSSEPDCTSITVITSLQTADVGGGGDCGNDSGRNCAPFIIVATDGVWDVLDAKEAATAAWHGGQPISRAGDDDGRRTWCPQSAADSVVELAVERLSKDNVTAAVLMLS